jgi:hypothetical protein
MATVDSISTVVLIHGESKVNLWLWRNICNQATCVSDDLLPGLMYQTDSFVLLSIRSYNCSKQGNPWSWCPSWTKTTVISRLADTPQL